MSHFSVAVFTHGPNRGEMEALLAPYDENKEVEPYIEYTRQQAIDYVRSWNKELKDASDDECYEYEAEEYREQGLIDAEGNLLSTYNPKSRWDWWQIGGRFSGLLRRHDGQKCNEAYISDCSFDIDERKYAYAERFWDEYVVGHYEPTQEDEFRDWHYGIKREWFAEQYRTKEIFALMQASVLPYAFLTDNGRWIETGKMGWWGVDDATAESRNEYKRAFDEYVKVARERGLYVTIVDCHI